MKHQIQIAGLQDLERAAREFLQLLGGRTLVAFYAPMGAGNTTFTTAVCKELGVEEDAISSPTFAIVNEYRGKGGRPILHFDFYRIDSPAEVRLPGFRRTVPDGMAGKRRRPPARGDLACSNFRTAGRLQAAFLGRLKLRLDYLQVLFVIVFQALYGFVEG